MFEKINLQKRKLPQITKCVSQNIAYTYVTPCSYKFKGLLSVPQNGCFFKNQIYRYPVICGVQKNNPNSRTRSFMNEKRN